MYFGGFLRQSNYNQKKLRPEKKGRVRDRYYDRKKSSSRLSGGYAIGVRSLLQPEIKKF
jgi:hypothetical protein